MFTPLLVKKGLANLVIIHLFTNIPWKEYFYF